MAAYRSRRSTTSRPAQMSGREGTGGLDRCQKPVGGVSDERQLEVWVGLRRLIPALPQPIARKEPTRSEKRLLDCDGRRHLGERLSDARNFLFHVRPRSEAWRRI
jgi:hypothetical protein